MPGSTQEFVTNKDHGHPAVRGLLHRLRRQHVLCFGAALFAIVCIVAVFAALLATAPPQRIQIRSAFAPPSAEHLFGTDNLGRDVFSRVVLGSRISLSIGLLTVALTGLAGTLIGLLAGYFRSWDEPLMRIMDALMAFPGVMLAVAIAAALGPGALNVVLALAAVYVPRTARVVRASTLVLREMDFVTAARALGASDRRILLGHILPNALTPLVVQLTFVFAYAILSEAALSFLGLGPPPPTPTWGNVIADGRDYLREAPWISLFPGLAISFTVLGLNLFGDGLRDFLDPRLKEQY